ncbi:MAG: hypothetical protein JSV91_07205 [Phycisphaerales bacterium]|nr:MAG: hypothetical protein JSV91_07205 [Phycisphaerales bacterium]
MKLTTPAEWARHLRTIAEPRAPAGGGRATPPLGAGALDRPFALAVGAAGRDRSEAIAAPDPLPGGEIGLWWALVDDSIDVDGLVAAPTAGSLLPQGLFRTIEVWTDAELCGLHALWNLARRRNRPDWRKRVEQVRDWHLLNTQPDNATNRPWALHVFALGGSGECLHYAETLLQNALILAGRPDPLSAWILLDAAREIEGHAQ